VSRRPKTTAWTLTTILIVAIAVVFLARNDQEHRWPAKIHIRLPNGEIIRAEVTTTWSALERGLMGRPSLSFNEGMLFVYPNAARHPHWMYQCLVPLDIVWLKNDKRVLEIVHGAQPCSHVPCPSYGHHDSSRFVLELAMGRAERSGLRVGDRLEFPIIAIPSVGRLNTSVASRPSPSATWEPFRTHSLVDKPSANSRPSPSPGLHALRTIESLRSLAGAEDTLRVHAKQFDDAIQTSRSAVLARVCWALLRAEFPRPGGLRSFCFAFLPRPTGSGSPILVSPGNAAPCLGSGSHSLSGAPTTQGRKDESKCL
jgi:uncharacterized protein